MLSTRSSALVLAALVVAMAAAQARAAEPADKEAKLIAVLTSDAPPANKAITCKQLAVYGSKNAVPALAALLPDKDLASWARIALEAIPDPACDDALRAAMGKVQGRLLIGVINSIGVRRDAKATDALVGKLKDADAQVACAAAAALGRIGGDKPASALEAALATAPPPVRSTAAHACVRCADRFLAEGGAEKAIKLYDAVRKAKVPQQRQIEAIRGAILARKAEGIPLLVEQLKAADKDLFNIGLRVARELSGPEATDALVAQLAGLKPNRRAMLILALADRGDPKALPAVLAAAKSGDKEVRLVAMDALEQLGNASCVPVLLGVALEADADVAKKAKVTLARLPGKDVEADIVARLPKATGKTRQVLIELVGLRRIEAALPALVECAGDADAGVRTAAVAAIGAIGTDKQVPDLVRILQKTTDGKERSVIEKALTGIGAREGAACVPHLMPLTKSTESAQRVIALHALASAGGPDALAAVKAALEDKDPGVQDEVARTLSTWPNKWPEDAAVAEPLLTLAKTGKKVPHRILGLRGYLQFVHGTKKLNDDARLAKVKEVLPLITRREEKRHAVSVLGSIRTAGSLEALVAFVADASVAEEACSAITELVRRRRVKGASKEQLRKALKTVVENSKSGRTRKRAADVMKGIR